VNNEMNDLKDALREAGLDRVPEVQTPEFDPLCWSCSNTCNTCNASNSTAKGT
jgi:hypothetical protein